MSIIRILLTALSLTLVPPQGWCCLPMGCHAKRLPATSDAAIPSVPSHCCCCQEESAAESSPTGNTPFQSGDSHDCHCRLSVPLYPADAPAQIHPPVDALIAPALPMVGSAPGGRTLCDVARGDTRGSPCPLYILHCVWLC
ncbi:MAG: hypothetical protein LC104_00540 [Bacteroidales bacterium]|nr:hypothetical protein [Bacteroidales bacterium]